MKAPNYDVVIVGAGSAGCVLAYRLTEDPTLKVLLLEAGPVDKRTEIAIPAAFPKLFKSEVDWAYHTEPQKHLDGRRMFWPRGRTLGGSSSINAMIYLRGHREIFTQWSETTDASWSYDQVLPYFRRSENFRSGTSQYHGANGPLHVSPLRDPNPLSEAFVHAMTQAGFLANDDFNADRQTGAGLFHVTQKRGRRHSTASAFLKPALQRKNLTVQTESLATRVVFAGRKVIGIEYIVGGRLQAATVGQAVLCGGAINSPQLLMLSGVGPARHLEDHQIEVVADRTGVGENLQDHLAYPIGAEASQPVSLANAESIPSLLRYLSVRMGPLTSNVGEGGGFCRLDPAARVPDLQFHFAPNWFYNHGFDNPPGHGMTIAPTLVCPKSRGTIRLLSDDPTQAPQIEPNYFSDAEDLQTMIQGVRLGRQILAQDAMKELIVAERTPGPDAQSDQQITQALRLGTETIYHPVGTCAMGRDTLAVVDPTLRVHGMEGLMVADASVMPLIPNANTNAACIMLGERAADLLKAGQGPLLR